MSDIHTQDEGNITILWAETPAAEKWCDEHLFNAQVAGVNGYVIEWRYLRLILDRALEDGLTVDSRWHPALYQEPDELLEYDR